MSRDATPTGSRGRSIAFRVLAGLGAFALLGFGVLFLVLTFVDDEQDIHALHNVAGFAYTVPLMAIPLILAVKDPLGTVASFRVVLAASVATGVAGVIGGTMESAVFTLVIAMVLLALHPARGEVLRLGALDVPLLALPFVAAIPAVMYGLEQADLQATRPASDPHAEFEHYGGMAAAAFSFVAAGAIAAFRGQGVRIARWLVGVGAAFIGAAFLAYPDHTSAIASGWAVAVLVLGVVYTAVGELLARRAM